MLGLGLGLKVKIFGLGLGFEFQVLGLGFSRRNWPCCAYSLGHGLVGLYLVALLTLYRMVMPIGTAFLKEKINN